MNRRLKELAEQAGLKVESFMTNPPKPFQILGSTEQFEKFAESIVRECANAIINDSRLNDVRSAANGCVRTINEHFGVE